MNGVAKIFFSIVFILVVARCSESAERGGTVTFREDFLSEKLSVFEWGKPTFSLYNFKADPSMVDNRDGINHLRLGQSHSNIYPTGFIYTKDRFSYGSYAARIRVSDEPGAVGSFFTCSEIAKVFTDGTHDEIDFEFITARPHAVLFTTWYMASGMEGGTQTPTHNSFLWEDPSFDIRQWHVYRFDWYPDRVEFYIDGVRRWTSTEAIPRRRMQLALHIYTIDTWKEVRFPPRGEVTQFTDWIEYKKFDEVDGRQLTVDSRQKSGKRGSRETGEKGSRR